MLITATLLGICVIIQSIYGVGLLIFGTPILLLQGMDFFPVLGLLLPSSLFISALQIYETRLTPVIETSLMPLSVLGIVIGIVVLKITAVPEQITFIMTFALFMVAILRSFPGASVWLGAVLNRHKNTFHFFNAVFHGFSNLGGTLLTIYSASVYTDKTRAIRCSASFYFVYASAQIIAITLIGSGHVFIKGLLFVPGALFTYFLIGRYSFKVISDTAFYRLATTFFWVVAFVFLAKSFSYNGLAY